MSTPTCGNDCRQVSELRVYDGTRLRDGGCNVCTWSVEYDAVKVVSLRGLRFNLCLMHAEELVEKLSAEQGLNDET